MRRIHFALFSTLALATFVLPSATYAQVLTDYATTGDQRTVGATFDSYGSTAAPSSQLEADYNQLFVGSSADVTHSVQSMLPTTAYNIQGAANSLSSVEESNIMGRLRTLRNREALAVRKVPVSQRDPLIKPLHRTDEAFHDLRGETKAPTLSSPHGTQKNYRSLNPFLYKKVPERVEAEYDEAMRLATIGAGVPNQHYRNTTGTHDLRIVPNRADRESTKFLKWSGDLAGQGDINATAQNGLPRHTLVTLSEQQRASTSNYRGQPLNTLANHDQPIPVPMARPSGVHPAYVPPAEAYAQAVAPDSQPYETAPPVIYGVDDPAPVAAPVIHPQPQARTAQPSTSTSYKKIDQSSGMTTPQIGTFSSSRVQIPQAGNYAMAMMNSELRMGMVTPARKPTEAGSLLWTQDDQAPAPQSSPSVPVIMESDAGNPYIAMVAANPKAPAKEMPLLAQSPRESYGSQAIPLDEEGAINVDRRWGFFLSGDTGFGDDTHQSNSAKAKTVTIGFTAGVDYRLQSQSYVGMAMTYARSNFNTGSLGDLHSNSTALSLYGTTTYATSAYVDGYLSLGYHSLDSERTIMAGNGTTRRAKGSPDGYQFSAKAETGYDLKQDAFTYGPYAGFRLAYADFNGFTEKEAGNFNLKVRGLDHLSAIGGLGFGGSYRHPMSNGGTLLPSVRVAYNHEFGDDRSTVKAEFANLAGSGFTTKGEKKSTDWISFAPAITASLPNDWTLQAQYEHDFFRDDANENLFNLAAHYKW